VDTKIEKKSKFPRLLAIAVFLAGATMLFSFARGQHGQSLRVEEERLTIATVHTGEFQEFVPVIGTTEPINTHYLDAIEGGRVEQVYREAGSRVTKGDKILRLSNTSLLMDVMFREAEFFGQSNNLRNTKLSLEQNRLEIRMQLLDIDNQILNQQRSTEEAKVLSESLLIPERDYSTAKQQLAYLQEKRELARAAQQQENLFRQTQSEQLEASLERMATNLELVKSNMDSLVIRAPVTGLLSSIEAEVGQSKNRGQRLGRIDELDGFRVRAVVREHYISRVQAGQSGTYTLGGYDGKLTVTKIYPEVIDGNFEIDMKFDGGVPEGIRRGQTMRIRLMLGDPSASTLVEKGAFFQETGGKWIFVLTESGDEARRQTIELGRSNSLQFEVLGGLVPGDRVIVSPYDDFEDVDRLVLR
jgi:HlyD family secretion protein